MERDQYWAMSNANPARRRRRIEAAIPEDRTGCWEWPGARLLSGYGVMRSGEPQPSNGRVYVHRASYEMFVGPIPDGYFIDHLCRNKACFNPAHLEPVTNTENVLRGVKSLREDSARVVCKSGHAKTPENTITHPDGRRRCRPCNLAWQAARRQRARQALQH